MDSNLKSALDAIILETKSKIPREAKPRGRKSDFEAKEALVKQLRSKGEYDSVEITSTPADITALRDSQRYYFEIKVTDKRDKYFGAATLTEWEAALTDADHFKFVIAFKRDGNWSFHEYTPLEFMEYSYIPPFKIYFNVPLESEKTSASRKTLRAIRLTQGRLREMSEFFNKLRLIE
jgi:hypothetical protein